MAVFFLILMWLMTEVRFSSGVTTALLMSSNTVRTEIPTASEPTIHSNIVKITKSSTMTPITTTTPLENHEELKKFRKKLDELFDQTMTLYNSFVKTKNNTIAELTINLTKNYVDISRKYIENAEIQNKYHSIIKTEEGYSYQYEDVKEYEEKLEIVEIMSNQLDKMFTNNTEYENHEEFQNSSNVIEEMAFLFDELYKLVKLKKKIKELGILEQKQLRIYKESQKIGDLNNDINTLTKIIKIQNEMINIIRNSNSISMKYLYREEYKSKSNLLLLVNPPNMQRILKFYEEALELQYYELKIEKALIKLDTFIRPIVLGPIFVVGIIGNVVLLLVFIFNKDMRSAPNVMVINLCISDILGLIINILMYIIESQVTNWTLGDVLCKLYRFSRFLVLGLSIYSIVVISVQRFIGISNAYSSGSCKCDFFGKYQPAINIIFVWVLASAFASVRGIKATVQGLRCWSGSTNDSEFLVKWAFVDFALYCAIPFIIIVVMYGTSAWRLKYSNKNMSIGQENALKARVLSSNVFVALIIVFAVCYMPYFLFLIYTRMFTVPGPFMPMKYLSFALYCLINSNASFNPIALYLMSEKYREYMRMYLCCRTRKRKFSTETNSECSITVETRI